MKRIGALLVLAVPLFAQDVAPAALNQYLGVATCVNAGCHGSTQPLDATRVLQNEYYTWLNNDRHAGAYNILFDDRSARIVKNMRLKKRAYEEPLCLDCHTTSVLATRVAGVIDVEDGIQCETCHGPASGWRAEHTEPGWTHAQSVERGMVDLQKISARANVCIACHVGNEKKEVAHELIASGHPLLAFELDNYTESMPPHWTPNRDTHGAPAWAGGQLAKFAATLANVARHAKGETWPEFADMSCFNCHHDLKDSSWRQQRGWPDRAGLPAWSPQHWAVLRVVIGRIAPAARAELEPVIAQLSRNVARMSDTNAIATNADKARRIITPLINQFDAKRFTDADVRALMTAIIDDPLMTTDVHTAEQAALSLQSLASTLTRRNPRLLRSPMTQAIDALFDEVKSRDDYDASRFAEKLATVKRSL